MDGGGVSTPDYKCFFSSGAVSEMLKRQRSMAPKKVHLQSGVQICRADW